MNGPILQHRLGAVTADSKPDHDDWFWDSFWNCSQWMDWHKKMVKKYGKSYANEKFIDEISKTTFGAHVRECKWSKDFVNYFASQGINIGHTLSKVVLDVSSGLENTAKFTKALPLIIVIAGLMYFFKDELKSRVAKNG